MIKKNYFWFSVLGHATLAFMASLIYLQTIKISHNSHHVLPAYVYHSRPTPIQEKKKEMKYQLKPAISMKKTTSVKNIQHAQPELLTRKATTTRELLMVLHDAIAEHQTYPESALELNQKGTVTLRFLLYPDGQVTHITIQHSSGIDSLDMAAYSAVKAISPFKNAKLYLQKAEYLSLDIIFQ